MITIGTRASALALTQSRWVAAQLAEHGYVSTLQKIVTQGDRVTHLALDKLAGKGFFTKEIEEALLSEQVDVAVHSLKDLPGEPTPHLQIAALPVREDARDVLVIAEHAYDPSAPIWPVRSGATIGTSAVRRKAQLRWQRPDLQTIDLRGNVPTRLAKLRQGNCDAVVLAQAGLSRLGIMPDGCVHHLMSVESFVPAPGQGTLGLQCRANDAETIAALRTLHHAQHAQCVAAERTLLTLLHAGCHVPLGAHAWEAGPGLLEMAVFFGGDRPEQDPWRFNVTGATAEELATRAFTTLQRAPQKTADATQTQRPQNLATAPVQQR